MITLTFQSLAFLNRWWQFRKALLQSNYKAILSRRYSENIREKFSWPVYHKFIAGYDECGGEKNESLLFSGFGSDVLMLIFLL